MKKILFFLCSVCGLLNLQAQTDTAIHQVSPHLLHDSVYGKLYDEGNNHAAVPTDFGAKFNFFYDTVPHKIYGVSVPLFIGNSDHETGADSIVWVYYGKMKKNINFYPFIATIDEVCKMLISNTKGPILDYHNRMLEYQIKAYQYHDGVPYYWYDTFASDMVIPCYEFYFDSAHTINAYDTFIVGGYNAPLDEYYVRYYYFWDRPRPEYALRCLYLEQINDIIGVNLNFSLSKGDIIYSYSKPAQPMGNQGYAARFFPISPIIELRCTTPKAVRWTAIGSDTARFEWQLHDEAENFIVEVEDMIANTTTHDTLPSWQNYYTVHGLDTNTDCLQLRVQKSTRYTMKYYDTVVYSPWYELPLLGYLPEPPDTTQPIDTTQPVDTNQGILMAQGLQFSLQPNPVHDKAEVQLAAPADEGCTATLTDLSGRELQRITVPPATQSLTIDLTTLPAGTYLLTLSTPTASSTQRVVKGL